MAHDPNSFKKIAVLTGLTVLIGGAEISHADAATTALQTGTFDFSADNSSVTQPLSFTGFPTSLGTLLDVNVDLVSSSLTKDSTGNPTVNASVTFPGQPFASFEAVGLGGFAEGPSQLTTGLSSFTNPTWSASLALGSDGFVTWCGGPSCSTTGITVTYDYTPVSATPLPATLPLFAGGLAGLGLTTWRRRRKQTAKK